MAGTITEYLVGLGFDISDDDLNKFKDSLGKAGLAAGEVTTKAIGAATAVAAMVATIAEKYEDLYFASVRTNESAAVLEQFAYGSRAIGISADASRASLERFNLAMMANPGRQFLLNYLGVQTVGRSTKQVYDGLIETLAKMPRFLAFAYGGQFGMSPGEINERILLRQKEAAAEKDYAERVKESGLNLNVLAEKSNVFQQAVRGLWAENELLIAQVSDRWLPTMTSAVHLIDDWAKDAVRAGADTQGWSSTMIALGEAFLGIKGFEWLLRLVGLGGTATAVGMTGTAMLGVAGAVGTATTMSNINNSLAKQGYMMDLDGNLSYIGVTPQTEQKGPPSTTDQKTNVWGDKARQAPPSHILEQAKHVALETGPGGVQAFMASQGYPMNGAWCGEFAASVVKAAGGTPPANPAIASNWRNWGTPVAEPEPGDVAVRRGAPTGSTGSHVTFVEKYDPKNKTFVGVGGNQGRAEATYPADRYEFRRSISATDEARLSPSVGPSSKISITQTNKVTAHGSPKEGTQVSPGIFDDRLGQWGDSMVRQTKPLLH